MSVKGILYLINRSTMFIVFAGEVPPTYGQITGMQDLDYGTLRDLQPHFGDDYANLGFLSEQDALAIGVTPGDIELAKKGAWELKWSGLEQERFDLIENQRWRINRHQDEVMMGQTPTEDIQPVLLYCQAIRDLTKSYPDPFTIVWPALP